MPSTFLPIQGQQLAQNRLNAKDGRLDRELRTKTIIPPAYATAVWDNPDNILGMPYLVADIKGMKKVLKALKKSATHNPAAAELHAKITLQLKGDEFTSPLCPIARHRMKRKMQRGIAQFLFETVYSEIRLETIVHGYSPTLEGVIDVIDDARRGFDVIRQAMMAKSCGYLEAGSFEADIRHVDDFDGGMPALTRLAQELSWDVPDAGGYVVSSHRIVRVRADGFYRSLLNEQFPGYRRIHSKRFNANRSIRDNVDSIFDYIWKLDPHVNAIRDMPEANCSKAEQAVFSGPIVEGKTRAGYHTQSMLTQWALFYDRVGLEVFSINYVNQFALDWLSEDELTFCNEQGLYEEIHGYYSAPALKRPSKPNRGHTAGPHNIEISALRARDPTIMEATIDDPPLVRAVEVIGQVAGEPVWRTCWRDVST